MKNTLKILLKLRKKFSSLIIILSFSFTVLLIISSLSAGLRRSISVYYSKIDGSYLVKKGAIDPVFSIIDKKLPHDLEGFNNIHYYPEIWQIASTVENKSPLSDGLFSFITIGGVTLSEDSIYYNSIIKGSYDFKEMKFSLAIR